MPTEAQPLAPKIVEVLSGVSTATLTTVLLKKGLRNVWMRGTRPLRPCQPRVGAALGGRLDLRELAGADRLRWRGGVPERRGGRRRRRRRAGSAGAAGRGRGSRRRAGGAGGLDHGRGGEGRG